VQCLSYLLAVDFKYFAYNTCYWPDKTVFYDFCTNVVTEMTIFIQPQRRKTVCVSFNILRLSVVCLEWSKWQSTVRNTNKYESNESRPNCVFWKRCKRSDLKKTELDLEYFWKTFFSTQNRCCCNFSGFTQLHSDNWQAIIQHVLRASHVVIQIKNVKTPWFSYICTQKGLKLTLNAKVS